LILLGGYLLLIFVLSTRPTLSTPGPDFKAKDKLAHVAEYFVLGALMVSVFGRSLDDSKAVAFMFLVTLGATVGATDEMVQGYVSGRSRDVFDWVADVVGIAGAAGIFVFGARWRAAASHGKGAP
jgi:VanZ family protein